MAMEIDDQRDKPAAVNIDLRMLRYAIQNITGHPTLSLPAGVCANGVPFGLSVTGPRYRDLDLVALAERWEAAHPWPRVAPGYVEFNASMGLR